jgi:hypothetical protein
MPEASHIKDKKMMRKEYKNLIMWLRKAMNPLCCIYMISECNNMSVQMLSQHDSLGLIHVLEEIKLIAYVSLHDFRFYLFQMD